MATAVTTCFFRITFMLSIVWGRVERERQKSTTVMRAIHGEIKGSVEREKGEGGMDVPVCSIDCTMDWILWPCTLQQHMQIITTCHLVSMNSTCRDNAVYECCTKFYNSLENKVNPCLRKLKWPITNLSINKISTAGELISSSNQNNRTIRKSSFLEFLHHYMLMAGANT